jgi:hypothetical protein
MALTKALLSQDENKVKTLLSNDDCVVNFEDFQAYFERYFTDSVILSGLVEKDSKTWNHVKRFMIECSNNVETLLELDIMKNFPFFNEVLLGICQESYFDSEKVVPLIVPLTSNINLSDDKGNTILYYLCSERYIHTKPIRILLEKGAIVTTKEIDTFRQSLENFKQEHKSMDKEEIKEMTQTLHSLILSKPLIEWTHRECVDWISQITKPTDFTRFKLYQISGRSLHYLKSLEATPHKVHKELRHMGFESLEFRTSFVDALMKIPDQKK